MVQEVQSFQSSVILTSLTVFLSRSFFMKHFRLYHFLVLKFLTDLVLFWLGSNLLHHTSYTLCHTLHHCMTLHNLGYKSWSNRNHTGCGILKHISYFSSQIKSFPTNCWIFLQSFDNTINAIYLWKHLEHLE